MAITIFSQAHIWPCLAACSVMLVGCSEQPVFESEPTPEPVIFPASLTPIENEDRAKYGLCRGLEASEAIANWSAQFKKLVGCPTQAEAERLGGLLVGIVDGFFIVAMDVEQITSEASEISEASQAAETGETGEE
ncbi:MAG: hypothetical protein HRT77_16530 [Halioglobus sp.]|nr:hypothetical protein [Halioglobus sp.]